MTVQALFIDPEGPYPRLLGPENCWDEKRDARKYEGPDPVVAHPPCNLWVNMAAVNYARSTRRCEVCASKGAVKAPSGRNVISTTHIVCQKCKGTGRREPNRMMVLPAWYPGGDDGGCFASALSSVRKFGGVLEHPAGTHAWAKHHIDAPSCIDLEYQGWFENYWAGGVSGPGGDTYYTCEVWQSAYGHKARKRTWLLYCGKHPPFELDWTRNPGTCQIGWFDRNKPTLGKKEASRTPDAFALELIRLAEWSNL